MALAIGSKAPDFAIAGQFGAVVRLSELLESSSIALVFLPLAFSPTCTNEVRELRDHAAVFADAGVAVVVVSVDSKATLRAWAEIEGLDFALLADFWPHGAVAREYDVFLDDRGYASRTTFLIDRAGVIRGRLTSDLGAARSVADYRAALADPSVWAPI